MIQNLGAEGHRQCYAEGRDRSIGGLQRQRCHRCSPMPQMGPPVHGGLSARRPRAAAVASGQAVSRNTDATDVHRCRRWARPCTAACPHDDRERLPWPAGRRSAETAMPQMFTDAADGSARARWPERGTTEGGCRGQRAGVGAMEGACSFGSFACRRSGCRRAKGRRRRGQQLLQMLARGAIGLGFQIVPGRAAGR